jgi:hypothetical protein
MLRKPFLRLAGFITVNKQIQVIYIFLQSSSLELKSINLYFSKNTFGMFIVISVSKQKF